jgi:hypothetical protein
MQRQNHHIVLLCDNASSHSHDNTAYSNVKVIYLPPNLTAWLQPMAAGIIKNFKACYRRFHTRYALELDVRGVVNPYQINQLEATRLADCAWAEVSPTTIQNCWRRTGICPEGITGLEDMLAQTAV